VQHKALPSLKLNHFDYQENKQDSLQYGYFQNLLELSDNKRLKRWANRKKYDIYGFNVINTSNDFRKGYQLKFYSNGKKLNLVRNEWVAKKARQRGTATPIIALPFYFLEIALFHKDEINETDEYGFSTFDNDQLQTVQAIKNDHETRKKANLDLKEDLKNHDISHKVLPFGEAIYGIIIIESKEPITNITVGL
jgi:hypothetical protein